MKLHCLPTETSTTASSCSSDPLYDNCPPFTQRGRAREREMESRIVCPVAVTRPPGPCSRPAPRGLAPAVAAEVPTLFGGGRRGTGSWPDHSYCSWIGGGGLKRRPAWEEAAAEPDRGMDRARGREGGDRRCVWGIEDRANLNQSPNPSQSNEHRSALSLYDNLPDTDTPDSLQEVVDMEANFQEQMFQAWAPQQNQEGMDDEAVSECKSSWSSCEIILAESGSSNQDQYPGQDNKHQQESELDSGSSLFKPFPPPQQIELLKASSPQPSRTEVWALWPLAEFHPEQQAPRVPPPVPLADPSASALRSILTSLQQQISRQKDEYEERIISLEQRNEDLQVEVVRLKTNLTQQHHWYQVVQAKIAESERARAAAELHNATLQREMEQFFDTFGELNNEAKKTECIVQSF